MPRPAHSKHDRDDHDTVWKEALRRFFPEFLLLVAPEVHAAVDWSKGVRFLPTQLRKVQRNARLPRGDVDLLARVALLDGQHANILAHVEAQHQPRPGFDRRMYRYYIALVSVFHQAVFSIAVFTGPGVGQASGFYDATVFGSGAQFRYRVVALRDMGPRIAVARANGNPFAFFASAHLRALERGDDRKRLEWKLSLVREAVRAGTNRRHVIALLRMIDWTLALPEALEREFERRIDQLVLEDTETPMRYVTSWERRGIEKGREEGRKEGREEGREMGRREALRLAVLRCLRARFGEPPHALAERVQTIDDAELLGQLLEHAAAASDLSSFEARLPQA